MSFISSYDEGIYGPSIWEGGILRGQLLGASA